MRNSIRALVRSTPHHSTRPPQSSYQLASKFSSPRNGPPEGASCSRWLTCSQCQRQPTKSGNFFSHTEISEPLKSESLQPLDDFRPNASPEYVMRAKKLPLPPTLPYSPESVPFKRHIELLQLALSSHPDESWETFLALHPSLQRHIPNRLYASLVQHQLNDTEEGWRRFKRLAIFAEECGMRVDEFGLNFLVNVLQTAATVMPKSQERRREELKKEEEIMFEVWDSILRSSGGEVRQVQPTVLKAWLTWLQYYALAQRGMDRVHAARYGLDFILPLVFEKPLPVVVPFLPVFLRFRSQDQDFILYKLSTLVECLSRGISMDIGTIRRVIGIARSSLRQAFDSDDKWIQLMDKISSEMSGPHALEAEQIIAEVVAWIRQRHPSGIERAVRLEERLRHVRESENRIPALIRQCLWFLNKAKVPKSEVEAGKSVSDSKHFQNMTIALDVFEKVAYKPSADVHVLVTVIIQRLKDLRSVGEPKLPHLIIRFTNALFVTQLHNHIDSNLIHMLMGLNVGIMNTSYEGYLSMRKVYIAARSADVPYLWSKEKTSRWRWGNVFRKALQHHHVHFASRLYADLLADGDMVHPSDMVAFIRTIGSMSTRSKYVLLDRYLRDYLHFHYGPGNFALSGFVKALVEGLTARGRPREAWLAFHLSKRILGDRSVPLRVYSLPLDVLSRSQRIVDNRRAIELLEYVEKGDDFSPLLYRIVLRGLTQRGYRYADAKHRSNVLAVMKEVYGHMISRGVKPDVYHVDHVVQVFLRAEDIDRGLKILQAASTQRKSVMAKTVNDAILLLCRASRFDEARSLLESCRKAVYDNGRKQLEVGQAVISIMSGSEAAERKKIGSDVLKRAERFIETYGTWSDGTRPLSKPVYEIDEVDDDEIESTITEFEGHMDEYKQAKAN